MATDMTSPQNGDISTALDNIALTSTQPGVSLVAAKNAERNARHQC
jgi:hypothetical protein